LLGYIHIAFQPFFINAISMHFIPQRIAKKVETPAYVVCFITAVIMLLHLYPLPELGQCQLGSPLCSQILCSVHGNWHIAWDLPLNRWYDMWMIDMSPVIPHVYIPYVLAGFVVPVLYGSWRFTIYHILMGPFLAKLLTDNPNEWPAVWCLLSIGLLLIVVKTPIRKWLYVRRWWWGKA
jgi:hypothetical protein